jgi:hypothetical protein
MLFSILLPSTVLSILYSCSTSSTSTNENDPIRILPLTEYNRTVHRGDTASSSSLREEHYLLSTPLCNESILKQIDSFVCERYSGPLRNYRNMYVYFFRKSDVTNINYLHNHPKEFDRYSFQNDLICSFGWIRGQYAAKQIKLCTNQTVPRRDKIWPCAK